MTLSKFLVQLVH